MLIEAIDTRRSNLDARTRRLTLNPSPSHDGSKFETPFYVLVPRTCILEYRAYLFYPHNAWVITDLHSMANVVCSDIFDALQLMELCLYLPRWNPQV